MNRASAAVSGQPQPQRGRGDLSCGAGAVAVPILHEFTPEQIYNILEHSESKLFFVGDQVWPDLNADKMPGVQGIFGLHDFSLMVSRSETITNARERLNELFGKKFPKNFRKEHVSYRRDEHVHRCALLVSERTEDGAGRVDGERAVVEEIRGAAHQLQSVDEAEASLLRLQVDSEHAARRLAELTLRQSIVRIVGILES